MFRRRQTKYLQMQLEEWGDNLLEYFGFTKRDDREASAREHDKIGGSIQDSVKTPRRSKALTEAASPAR